MCFLWSPLNWDLPTPLPQFSLKLPFLHKLLKFKFLPRDTLLNIYSYHNELALLAYIAWFHQIKVTMQCDLIVSLGGSKRSWGGTLAPWGGWSDSVFNHDGPAPPFLLSLGWTLIVLIAPHTLFSQVRHKYEDQVQKDGYRFHAFEMFPMMLRIQLLSPENIQPGILQFVCLWGC